MDSERIAKLNITMYKNRILDRNFDDFMRLKREQNSGEKSIVGSQLMQDLIYELAGTNIIETNEVETASMEYFMNNYRIKINPDFIKKYFLSKYEVEFVMCHEILHKLNGDFFRSLGKDDGEMGKMLANVVMDININSALMSYFHGSFRFMFENLYDRKSIISYMLYPLKYKYVDRNNSLECITNELKRNFHFKDEDARELAETYCNLWRREGYLADGYAVLSKHFKKQKMQEDVIFLGDHEFVYKIGYKSCMTGILPKGWNDKDAKYQVNAKAIERQNIIINALRRAVCTGNNASAKSFGLNKESSAIPALSRKDFLWMSLGTMPLIYSSQIASRINDNVELNIFIDVSGSFDNIIEFVYGVVVGLKEYNLQGVYLFSTIVKKITINELRKGNVVTTGGTYATAVLEHALTHKMKKIILITDAEFETISESIINKVKQSGMEIYLLIINRRRRVANINLFAVAKKWWFWDV